MQRRIDGAKPESRSLVQVGSASRWQRHGALATFRHPEILQLYVRQSVYERAVEEMYACDGSAVGVVPRFAFADPLLEQLAIAVIQALRDGSTEDRLYIETIAELIAVHLARSHSSHSRPRPAAAPSALSRHRIRKLLDYIEQHLGEDLSLEALAAEVELSPLYLARAFRLTVGQSPHRYVVGRRVERAKQLLCATETPIADVALVAGFSSQSHLSNWFRRMVGVSPGAYRRHG
jgi:AraC family transcriptional regulator